MTSTTGPGHHMAREMLEQPRVLRALADRAEEIAATVAAVAPEPPAGTVIVARGSSDHAAVYARYLLEYAIGRPVALAAPSLYTRYDHRGDLTGWMAIGVSQSGATPEIVETLGAMGRAGARTLALTNVAGSALAEAADAALVLDAGDEIAVPATKTLTAQFAAFAHVAAGLGPVPWAPADWDGVVGAVDAALDDPDPVDALASRLGGIEELLVVARGFLYPAALEVGLKVAETNGIHTTGYSSADLRHGPIAVAEPGLHALCLVAAGPVARDVGEVAAALRARGVAVHAITEDANLVPAAEDVVPVASGVPEALAPLVQLVRGQQLARSLALVRGVDPDTPRGLNKVTLTT